MDFFLSLELLLRVDWLRKQPLNDRCFKNLSVFSCWLLVRGRMASECCYILLSSIQPLNWHKCFIIHSRIHAASLLQTGRSVKFVPDALLGSLTYPLTFHNGPQNEPIFSSRSLPVNSHHPDGSSPKMEGLAHIVTSEKYRSLLSWQPIDTLGEEGSRDTFFYYLSSNASSFISYTLAADCALCRCCLWSVNQSVQAGRMSSEGLVGLLIIKYSPHQQTHSVTGT